MKKQPNKRKIVLTIAAILSAVLIFATGFMFGNKILFLQNNFQISIKQSEEGKPKNLNFDVFWAVWNKVLENYPGKADQQKMLEGATKGILVGLGDPYSEFLTSSESKQLMEDLQGSFNGIGVELSMKNGVLTVVSALEGTPAQRVGIKAQDVITQIGDKSTEGMSLNEAVSLIRGEKGTKIGLKIFRSTTNQTLDFNVERDEIKVKSVKWELKDQIAYIKITQFGADTSRLFQQAVSEVLAKNPKGVVLDLRNNPGGYFDTSIDVASYFIKKGVVVYEEQKNGKKQAYRSNENGSLSSLKTVILINGGSASASEIVAGAIQDYEKGTLVGEKTYGKGSVQVVENLQGGNSLRLTIANWLTPDGRRINSTGIEPDIEVKLTEEDVNKNIDPQLQKALEIVNQN